MDLTLFNYQYFKGAISSKMDSSTRHQIAQFVRNQIAPGGRAFISHEIEQAIRDTFGNYPIKVKGQNFPLQVLWEESGETHIAVWEQLREVSRQIFDQYQRQETVDYDSELASIYYSLYYLPRNLHKVQFVLLDLFERGMLPQEIRALDIGSAVGTVPLAVADFTNLLRNTCALFDIDLESNPQPNAASFSCLDASASNLENLRRIWSNLTISSDHFPTPETHMVKIGLEEKSWQEVPSGPYNLVFASNFLNELVGIDIQQRAHLLEIFASHLSEDGLMILIEPADETNAKNLHALQWELSQRGFHACLPCSGQEDTDHAVARCQNCWSWRSEKLRMPSVSKSLIWDLEKSDDESIKWCFTVLGRQYRAHESKPLSTLSKLPMGEVDVRVRTISPIIGQKWVKVCGSDKNPEQCILELEEHQVLTDFTPGDSLTLQRVEVSPPVRFGPFAGANRLRFTVKSQSFNDERLHENHLLLGKRIRHPQDKEPILRYFLQRLFGFPGFRSGQLEIIARILEGQDTFGIMATSAGKSLCFQFPAMLLPGIAIIVAPLKSLVQDQVYNLRRMGFDNVVRIDSDAESIEVSLNRVMEGYYKLVYITPEQLTNERVVAKLHEAAKRYGISLFAVDEVHCLSQWGHDFRPAYLNLYRHFCEIDPPSDKDHRAPISGLTATASEYVIEDVLSSLHFEQSTLIRHSFDRPELSFEVIKLEQDDDRLEKLIQVIDHHLPNVIRQPIRPGIIFVPYTGNDLDQSKEIYRFSAEGLTRALKERGYNAAFHHSSMSVSDREQVQEDFKNGNIDILVATKGFGMGIDKEDIRFIIHFLMPESPESYYQQAGRAGRGGEHSHCILLYQVPANKQDSDGQNPSDYNRQEYFINNKYPGMPERICQAWEYLRGPKNNFRGSPNREILYLDPDQALLGMEWIAETELQRAKAAKVAGEEWEKFKQDWNRLIQALDKNVSGNRCPIPGIEFLRSVPLANRNTNQADWDYILKRVKDRKVRAEVQNQLARMIGSYENPGRLVTGIAEKFQNYKPDHTSAKQLDDLFKDLERVLNALQRMGFVSAWDKVQTIAMIQRKRSWAEIENLVSDPYVQRFIQNFKTKFSPEQFSKTPSGNLQETDLVSLYQLVNMDVIQLHSVFDFLKKRKILNVTYKQPEWIVRLNSTWITIPYDEQLRRFEYEFDLLEKRHRREYDMLDSMQRYIDTNSCRRQSIVGYFLQKNQTRVIVRCNFCDNCCPDGITGEKAQLEEGSQRQLEVVQKVRTILEDDLSLHTQPTNTSLDEIKQTISSLSPQEGETPIWDIIANLCESHVENRCIGSWRAPFIHMVMGFEEGYPDRGLNYFRRLKTYEQFRGLHEQLHHLALIVREYCPNEYDVVETLYETAVALSLADLQKNKYLERLISIDYDRQPDYLFQYGLFQQMVGKADAKNYVLDAFHAWARLNQITSIKSGILLLAQNKLFQEDLPEWIRFVFEKSTEIGFTLLDTLTQQKVPDNVVLLSLESLYLQLSVNPRSLLHAAKLSRAINAHHLEIECHLSLLTMANKDESIDRYQSHAALVRLFSKASPCQNIEKYQEHSKLAARLADDVSTKLKFYLTLCENWDAGSLDEEIVWIEQQQSANWGDIVSGLLNQWKTKHESQEATADLLRLFAQWKMQERTCYPKSLPILSKVSVTEVVKFPELLPDWIIRQSDNWSSTINWLELFTTLNPALDNQNKVLLLRHILNNLERSGLQPDRLASTSIRSYIENLNYSLFTFADHADETHRLWWKICIFWPDRFPRYLNLVTEKAGNEPDLLLNSIRFVQDHELLATNPDIITVILDIYQHDPKRFPSAFISTSLKELAGSTPTDLYQRIDELLMSCILSPDRTRFDYVNALAICKKLRRDKLDMTVREAAVSDDIFINDIAFLVENYVELARCYELNSPLANQEKCFEYCVQAVQLDKELFSDKMLLPYRDFLALISWNNLRMNLNRVENSTANPHFSPLLLSIWLRKHNSREEQTQICSYLAEGDRFIVWEEKPANDLIDAIDLEILSDFQTLLNYVASKPGKFYARFKSQSSWALKQSIHLCRKGLRFPEQQAKEIWNSIQLMPPESLYENFEQLLGDLDFAKCYFKDLIPNGTVISANACIAFFKMYSIEKLSESYPELSLNILISVSTNRWGTNLSEPELNLLSFKIRNLFKSLTTDPQLHKDIYAAWLKFCRIWPSESIFALKDAISKHPEYYRLIDSYWECYIGCASMNELENARKDLSQFSEKELTPRIKSGLFMLLLFDELGRRSDITFCNPLEGKHFREIFEVFKPKTNLERAYMTIALIDALKNKFRPGWLTPLSFYVEALAYAGLEKEANAVAINSPELRIGPKRLPVQVFISEHIEKHIKPSSESYREDYLKLSQKLVSEWAIQSSKY